MSAPLFNSSRATPVLLLCATMRTEVSLFCPVCLFTSASSCTRYLTTSVWLLYVTIWWAVWLATSLTFTGISSFNIRSTVLTSPYLVAPRNLRTSCRWVSRYEKELYANWNETIWFLRNSFPTKLILTVFKLVQLKNKSFWLEISWTKTILQNFWKGNRNLIKQNSTEGKWAFFEINCKPFRKRECFLSGILLLNMLNLNRKKWTIRILSENILGNFVLHETKKWTTCDVNCKPIDKCEYFVFGILSLNMLNSNVKKLMKHSFKQKTLGKFVFHETK